MLNNTNLILQATPVITGSCCGKAIVSTEPLSFWGGINPETGDIIDQRHEKCGLNICDKIFFFPNGRGSSTSSAILLECIRNKTAPAAIINSTIEPILALGSIVADELYQTAVPIWLLDESAFSNIRDDDYVNISSDGQILIKQNKGIQR